MPLSTAACLEAIGHHSAGLVDAARGALPARVEHCPGWSVADLVWHLTEVHWFWAKIAAERPSAPPDAADRPVRPSGDELVGVFAAGAARLVEVLEAADPAAPCWTWAAQHQNVGFIVRHQVQEAAVHHWDIANAAGEAVEIAPAVAADAVDEFLDVSLEGAFDGALELRAVDTGDSWTVGVPSPPGPLPVLAATAAELLLWLYGRVVLDTAAVPAELLAAFRSQLNTD